MEFGKLDLGKYVAEAFNEVTPDLNKIYEDAKLETVTSVRTRQGTLAAASGAASFAIPVMHVTTALADLGILMNRMAVAAYSIGAVKGTASGKGNVLEDEDFKLILGLWAGDGDIDALIKQDTDEAEVWMQDAGVKLVSQMALKHLGLAVGRRMGTRLAGRFALRLGMAFAPKTAAGFVPIVGAAVGAGVNYRFMESFCEAAETFYNWKCGIGRAVETEPEGV